MRRLLNASQRDAPLGPLVITGASMLSVLWLLAVQPRFTVLFAAVFAGALLPDVIDLGPAMMRRLARLGRTIGPVKHIFPWHW